MNIALSAVFIFILLIPPIAFYVSYSFGQFAKAGPKFSLLDGVLASAIFSLLIHTVAITITGSAVRFDLLLKLLGGELKDVEAKVTNADFKQGLQQFGLYNAITFFLALVLGRFARFMVQYFDVHHRYELLRLHNKWWYLFNGYYLTAIGYEKRNFDLLFVDAMVSTNEGTLIYSGYLVEFVCTGEELDRIYLNDATRRKIKSKVAGTNDPQLPDPESSAPVVIPGQLLSIPYREIRNLNLRFINLELSLEEIEALPNDFDIPTEEELHDLDEAEADLF